MAITPQEFLEGSRAAKAFRVAEGAGPVLRYRGDDQAPLIWFDQFFERAADPTGILVCSKPLRIGGTMNRLDVVVAANNNNAGTLLCPAGSSISIEMFECDEVGGTFTSSGLVVKATIAAAKNVDPGSQLVRFAIGNMTKAWAYPKVTFTGAFAGGLIDVGLAYMPH